jgi:hypothetical protein
MKSRRKIKVKNPCAQGWQAQWPALRRGEKSLPSSLYKREGMNTSLFEKGRV